MGRFTRVDSFIGSLEGHLPLPEDDDPVRDEENIGNIVTDQDCSEIKSLPVMDNRAQDRIRPDGVLTGGRLVEENDLWVCDKRPCNGYAFLHPA